MNDEEKGVKEEKFVKRVVMFLFIIFPILCGVLGAWFFYIPDDSLTDLLYKVVSLWIDGVVIAVFLFSILYLSL